MRKKTPNSASGPLPSGKSGSESPSEVLRGMGIDVPDGEPPYGDDLSKRNAEPWSANQQMRTTNGDGESQDHSGLDDEPKLEADLRITRKKWPTDRKKRLTAMRKVMPEAIRDYKGSVTLIAARLNVMPADVSTVIDKDKTLQELVEIARNKDEAELLDIMDGHAKSSRSPTAAKWLLERKYSDKYGRAPAAKPKKTRRSSSNVPMAPDQLPSALMGKT